MGKTLLPPRPLRQIVGLVRARVNGSGIPVAFLQSRELRAIRKLLLMTIHSSIQRIASNLQVLGNDSGRITVPPPAADSP